MPHTSSSHNVQPVDKVWGWKVYMYGCISHSFVKKEHRYRLHCVPQLSWKDVLSLWNIWNIWKVWRLFMFPLSVLDMTAASRCGRRKHLHGLSQVPFLLEGDKVRQAIWKSKKNEGCQRCQNCTAFCITAMHGTSMAQPAQWYASKVVQAGKRMQANANQCKPARLWRHGVRVGGGVGHVGDIAHDLGGTACSNKIWCFRWWLWTVLRSSAWSCCNAAYCLLCI